MEFLQNAEPLLLTFWYIAAPVTIIFIVQTIMTFIGADSMDGINADFDGDIADGVAPFQLFSFRNLINFLLGFGWGGIAFHSLILNEFILIAVAAIVGILFVAIFFVVISILLRLAENNTFNIKKTLNHTAEIYLTVPANRLGKGKVLVSVNGSMHELEAMTDADENIVSRSIVKIVKIEDNNILMVEKI